MAEGESCHPVGYTSSYLPSRLHIPSKRLGPLMANIMRAEISANLFAFILAIWGTIKNTPRTITYCVGVGVGFACALTVREKFLLLLTFLGRYLYFVYKTN